MKKYLIIGSSILLLLLVGLYIFTLIPSEDPNRTNAVFVYDSLKNSAVRAVVCKCRTSAEPLLWEGYTLSKGIVSPHQTDTIKGKIIMLNAAELKQLDLYKETPKVHQRKQVTISGQRVSIYLKKS